MKKDWEIIREILLRLEDSSTANTVVRSVDIKNFPEQDVAYNIRLLNEGGFLIANILESTRRDGRILSAIARRLTNSGHELLGTIRNDGVWARIKEKFESKGIDMTFDMVSTVGRHIIESVLQ